MKRLILGGLLAASLSTAAQATVGPLSNNLIFNGSFEDIALTFVPDANVNMAVNPGSDVITGWTVFGAETGWVGMGVNDWGIEAADGNKSLDFTGYHNDNSFGGVTQEIMTDAGMQYELVLHIGFGGGNGSGDYAGPASVRVIAGDQDLTFTSSGGTSNTTTWEQFSFVFTANSAWTTVSFQGAGKGGCCFVGLDDVSVTALTPVPEPETYGLLAAGLGLIGWRLRRRGA